jgi:two-component system alkaline phosphatase synthesis response regulator PhoP
VAGLKNVIVVEDDAMIRDLYRSALLGAGYNVEVAGSSVEFYAKLDVFHPDCVFLDIMLPGVSGLEILKELRTNPARGCMDKKIVILTNLAQRSVADTAMNAGADGYIIKADILPKDLPAVLLSLEEDDDGSSTPDKTSLN